MNAWASTGWISIVLNASIRAVIDYLERADPDAAVGAEDIALACKPAWARRKADDDARRGKCAAADRFFRGAPNYPKSEQVAHEPEHSSCRQ